MKALLVLFVSMLGSAWAADATRIQVHGHRGARALFPENTLPAFEHAIQNGADYIELDLAVTKDNVLVVSHDPVLHAPMCSGGKPDTAINTLTLAQVKQWDCGATRNPAFAAQEAVPGTRMPTLAEVFALAPRGQFRFNVEIKSDPSHPELQPTPLEFAKLVAAEIRKAGLVSRAQVQSFDFRTLHAMHQVAPEIPLVALYYGAPKSFIEIAEEAGTKVVSPEHHLITPEAVKEAHAAGLRVVPWTANTTEDWARLRAAGVDEIITDDPAALIAFLKAKD